MDNNKLILGADCPACDSFVAALPVNEKHSRWKWYMHCCCGVIFFTEKTYSKADTVAVEA